MVMYDIFAHKCSETEEKQTRLNVLQYTQPVTVKLVSNITKFL